MFDQSTVEYLKWGTTQLLYISVNLVSTSLIEEQHKSYCLGQPVNKIKLGSVLALKTAAWSIQYVYHSTTSSSSEQAVSKAVEQNQKFVCDYSPVLYGLTQLAPLLFDPDMQLLIQPIDAGNANFFFASLAGKCHSDELDSND